MNTKFKFQPMDFVVVSLQDLNYRGRVIRCILESADQQIFDVELWINGEPRRKEFYADELEFYKK